MSPYLIFAWTPIDETTSWRAKRTFPFRLNCVLCCVGSRWPLTAAEIRSALHLPHTTVSPVMMDPAMAPLGQMLLEEITPVVMLLSTPSVEEASLKNGLSFLQTLTPFCSFNNIDGNLISQSYLSS